MLLRLIAASMSWLLLASGCGAEEAPTTTATTDRLASPTIYETSNGQRIEIVNPSDEATMLLDWAFSRFDAAGLPEPQVAKVFFGNDVAHCDRSSGWTRTVDAEVEVAICHAEDELCKTVNGEVLTTVAKLCALHELGHGWLIEHADAGIQAELLEHADLDVWLDLEVPWHERGAEYAAEVMAWGLMDRRLELHRIDSPSCKAATESFSILAGTAPLVACAYR